MAMLIDLIEASADHGERIIRAQQIKAKQKGKAKRVDHVSEWFKNDFTAAELRRNLRRSTRQKARTS